MKEQLVEKLFETNLKLSTDEIILIANSLKVEVEKLPFNHEEQDILKACGVKDGDVQLVNEKFSKCMKSLKDEEDRIQVSKVVEVVESLINSDPVMLRLIVLQSIKTSTSLDILKKLGGI